MGDLRAKHKLVVRMQDNAGEYKSDEIMQMDSEVISVHQKNNGRMVGRSNIQLYYDECEDRDG